MTREEAEKLFEENRKLAFYVINKYFPYKAGVDDDFEQEALMALWEAILTYDEDKGILSSYCVTGIKNALFGVLRKENSKNSLLNRNADSLDELNDHSDTEDKGNGRYYGETADETPVYLGEDISSLLTERELQVLGLIKKGYNLSEVSRELGISKQRVAQIKDSYKHKIMDNIVYV